MTTGQTASLSMPRPNAPPSTPAPSAPRSAAAGVDRGARPRSEHWCRRRQFLSHRISAAAIGPDNIVRSHPAFYNEATTAGRLFRADRHTCCASLGAGPRQGNPRDKLCGRQPSTPEGRPRQPRTNIRECGSQPAYQSLLTVVSAVLPPALRNSHTGPSFAGLAETAPSCPKVLTTNIREFVVCKQTI